MAEIQANWNQGIREKFGKKELYYCQYCPPKIKVKGLDFFDFFFLKHNQNHNKKAYFWQCLDSKWELAQKGLWRKDWKDEIKIIGEVISEVKVKSEEQLPFQFENLKKDFQAKVPKNRNLNRHRDKFSNQNHYREKELKKAIENSGLGHWKEVDEKTARESKNYLKITLKKWCGKNYSKIIIYKTCFFLHMHANMKEVENEIENRVNNDLIVHLVGNKLYNPHNENKRQIISNFNPLNTNSYQNEKTSKNISQWTAKGTLIGRHYQLGRPRGSIFKKWYQQRSSKRYFTID